MAYGHEEPITLLDSERRIKLSDIGPDRKKPCDHCGTRGRRLCKKDCFWGELRKTRISLIPPTRMAEMHAACLKAFPKAKHTGLNEENICKPEKPKKSRK